MPGNAGHPQHRQVVGFVVTIAMVATASCVTGASPGGPPGLEAVLLDAAKRTGTDARTVQVVRTEQREWPNSGLGCPRPGEMYAQVLTPGWLIEVRSGRRTLEYHTDAGGHFVLCATQAM